MKLIKLNLWRENLEFKTYNKAVVQLQERNDLKTFTGRISGEILKMNLLFAMKSG
jgi:hypothetical protein